jgi:NAD(P)-dependent dehydrogenase (short-subunit alcohol dehydrogenase family)
MRFSERVAIVTGAAQGIGRATAQMLVEEGATVVMNDIDGELVHKASAEMSGAGRAIPMVADVTQADQVERMVKQVVADLGRIDVLVNNAAGLYAPATTFDETTLEFWRSTLEYDLTSQFICCKHVVPVMKKQLYGRIVNVASGAGIRPTPRDSFSYSVAKAGVINLTKCLALELGSFGITANAVCPGDTMTERSFQLIKDGEWPETVEELMARHSGYPLGRPGEPREVAAPIVFLASEEASYVTGEAILALGGVYMTK